MKLTKQQANSLICESIARFNDAAGKMSLLSERRTTIEKILISESFSVAGILNYHQHLDLDANDESWQGKTEQITDVEGERARKIHASVPKSRKVFPPTNAVNGFSDRRLASYDLRFDEDSDDGLVTRSNLTKMSGVDTDFPIYAAYTTTNPGDDTPPCVEMLLNAIKRNDAKTPYRIDNEQLEMYEESAADRVASMIVANVDASLMSMKPVFVVVACPSRVRHTHNLAKKIEKKLTAGKTARNNPRIFTRQPSESASFVNLVRKVTNKEAADAIGDFSNPNCIRFLPDARVERRHNALHEMWKNYVSYASVNADAFYALTKQPNVNWLFETARMATTEDELGGPFDQIYFVVENLLHDYIPDADEDLSSRIVEELFSNQDESNIASRILGDNDPRIPKLLSFLRSPGDKKAMTKVYKAAVEQYQTAIQRLIAAELNTRPDDQGGKRLSETAVAKTYSMSFNDWVAQQQEKLDSQIERAADERPYDAFSISKVSAISGNRKHVTGFIVDNPEHDEEQVMDQVKSVNASRRPYILVIVDDNVETGTTMREVARRASTSMMHLTGDAGFAEVIGATALAIRGPTVRCSSITGEPYTLPENEI